MSTGQGRTPSRQPTWVRRDGVVAGTLGVPAAYTNIALSPNGRQLAVDRFDADFGIWLLDVARGTTTRETTGGTYQSTPVWAPDGLAFMYAASRDTPPNLYLKTPGRSGDDERMFRSRLQVFPQSWSADGQSLVYLTVDPTTGDDLWLLSMAGESPSTTDATGGRKRAPLLVTPFNESHARLSPDGRWLAYDSNEAGRQSVYVTRFPTAAGKWQVSLGGGGYPIWARDGRELFYRASDGMLMAVPVRASADFDVGPPRALFASGAAVGGLGGGTFYDVAADGRFIINKFVERTSPPATIVLNWRGQPPKAQN